MGTHIADAVRQAEGFLPFERFMALALYDPALGYYMRRMPFGKRPEDGSDFVTAPTLSRTFGQALAVAIADAFEHTGTDEIWEFGAGTGALARDVLEALDRRGIHCRAYHVIEVSGRLRDAQAQTLAAHSARVCWHEQLPPQITGVVLGNEVLDAMPVTMVQRRDGHWLEVGVALDERGALRRAERPGTARPPCEIDGTHPYETEIHPQAEAFVRTVGTALHRGAAFFIDYGFPEAEYYHPQRHMGTLMAHRAHRGSGDWLSAPGTQDLTAHVNFTGIALAAEAAQLALLGYTSQARFLMNCGILGMMEALNEAARALALKLLLEHEMGELFKVIGFTRGEPWPAIGFQSGDRSHTL